MDITAQEIIDEYHKAIENRSDGVFAWPDDSLSNHEWYYRVHVGWVRAWNKEGRETECVEFLRGWLTEENILDALNNCPRV